MGLRFISFQRGPSTHAQWLDTRQSLDCSVLKSMTKKQIAMILTMGTIAIKCSTLLLQVNRMIPQRSSSKQLEAQTDCLQTCKGKYLYIYRILQVIDNRITIETRFHSMTLLPVHRRLNWTNTLQVPSCGYLAVDQPIVSVSTSQIARGLQ